MEFQTSYGCFFLSSKYIPKVFWISLLTTDKNLKITSKYKGLACQQGCQQAINFRENRQLSGAKISLSLCRADQMEVLTALPLSSS